MLRISILIVLFIRVYQLPCQTSYPQSDLLLFNWTLNRDTFTAAYSQTLIPGQHDTYINQPCFFSDSIIFFNMLQKESSTTDIYGYNVVQGTFTQFTNTPKISEFSPQLQPDEQHFSVVRIEEDGKTQTIWSYPLLKPDDGKRLAPWISNIGYYVWLNEQEILAFLVDSVHQLKRINLKNKTDQFLSLQPGRSLKKRNADEFLFLDKSAGDKYTLKTYNKNTGLINTIMDWPFLTEDFDILSNKYIVASSKNELFIYNMDTMGKWTKIADIKGLGYKTITRIAIHPSGKLILVAHKN